MQKKSKKTLITTIVASITLSTALIALTGGALALSAYDEIQLNTLSDGNFYYDVTGGEDNPGKHFKCYNIAGRTNEIAIAWNHNYASTGSLVINPTIVHDDTTYTITAIYDAGFRYCKFTNISLPLTVATFGREAFAHCEGLTSFAIPLKVTSIPTSCFLNCRNLVDVNYKGHSNVSVGTASPIASTSGEYYIETDENPLKLYVKSWDSVSCVLTTTDTAPNTTEIFYYNYVDSHLFEKIGDDWVQQSNISVGTADLSTSAITAYYVKTTVTNNVVTAATVYKKNWTAENSSKVRIDNGVPTTTSAPFSTYDYYIDTSSYAVYVPNANSNPMAWVDASNGGQANTLGNLYITSIGDHAFDSCVSIRSFNCPENIVTIGDCAFQNCSSLTSFDFPAKKDGVAANICVGNFAFAYCTELKDVYMEENIKEIRNYAFVECNGSLVIRFTGAKNTYKNGESHKEMFYFGDRPHRNDFIKWRNTRIDTQYDETGSSVQYKVPVNENETSSFGTVSYPGLRYILSSDAAKLDAAHGNASCQITVIPAQTGNNKYAIITKFTTPGITIDNYYNVTTKELTIPEYIDGYPVYAIDPNAFANHNDIERVVFSENLKQIRHQAFFKCPNIKNLDFSRCKNLVEISDSIISSCTNKVENTGLTSLILPGCLKYIGDYAFAYFLKLNELKFHLESESTSSLLVIGDFAFYFMGKSVAAADAKVELILPSTLNDAEAAKAYMEHQRYPGANANGTSEAWKYHGYYRWCAIGKYAFDTANSLVSVKMESNTNSSHRCSLCSNSFVRSDNIVRFETSYHLNTVGKDSFKSCSSLRELFLSAVNVDTTLDYPWGINDEDDNYAGTLFTGSSPELVIYVNGVSSAPGKLDEIVELQDNASNAVGHPWNSETGNSYYNEYGQVPSSTNSTTTYMRMLTRKHVPTYFNVDYVTANSTDLIYWDPESNAILTGDDRPKTLSGYNGGVVSLVKVGTDSGNSLYAVARYFTDCGSGNVTSKIDLTNITGFSTVTTNKIVKIGDEAFSINQTDKAPGLYFILPDTVTEIGDRAFYRRTSANQDNNGKYGARIVTYAVYDSTNQVYKVVDDTNASYFANSGNSGTLDKYISTNCNYSSQRNNKGFCSLPSSITYIGRSAFYNNIFEKVYINSSTLSYFGNGAFAVTPHSTNVRAKVSSISVSTTQFETVTNGVYLKEPNGNQRMLVYQAQDGATTSLSIQDNTVAIGMNACANTDYQTIKLPGGLKTVYGGGLAKNVKLTTVEGVANNNNGLASLEYIGAMDNPFADYCIDSNSDSLYAYYPLTHRWLIETATVITDGTSPSNPSVGDFYIGKTTSNNNVTYTLYHYETVNEVSQWVNKTSSTMINSEMWIMACNSYFDNYDYRDYTYSKRGTVESLYGAFAGCVALTTMDFTQMGNLKKIGSSAFNGCKALKKMVGSKTYTYKLYKKPADGSAEFSTIENCNAISQSVLDLRDCQKLLSIDGDAFLGCTEIKFLHLPNNTPANASESSLYIGHDPNGGYYGNNTMTNAGSGIIFTGSNAADEFATKKKILVSESIYYANPSVSGNKSAAKHYNTNCFGSNNLVYYYVAANSTTYIPQNDVDGYKYWTYDTTDSNNRTFILFNDARSARHYFDNLS